MEKIERFIIRGMDIIASSILLVILSPIFLGVCYRIYKKEGKPIFYQKAYAGKNGKTFIMYSFRTMTIPSQVIFALPPHPSRTTKINHIPKEFVVDNELECTVTLTGKFLRNTRLYKLPRLWNVLKGDMSFFGPMPEIIEVAKSDYVWQKKKI